MKNIEKRDIYNKTTFDEMLENSDILVSEVVKELEKKYPKEKYKIISGFDNHKKGIINIKKDLKKLTKKQKILFDNFIYHRFEENNVTKEISDYIYKEQIIDDKIYNGMRAHDIAVIEKESKNIVELIECKDFPQLIYYGETGLPIYYLFKLTFLKSILEKRQGTKIKQSFIFKDNDYLKKNRDTKKIKIKIKEEPYGLYLTGKELLNKSPKTNSSGEIIKSNFLRKYTNSFKIASSAHMQYTWDVFKEMKDLKDLYNI